MIDLKEKEVTWIIGVLMSVSLKLNEKENFDIGNPVLEKFIKEKERQEKVKKEK